MSESKVVYASEFSSILLVHFVWLYPHDCLLNRLFRRRSKKASNLRVTGLCAGNSPMTGVFPAQMVSNAENVSVWWRHHAIYQFSAVINPSYALFHLKSKPTFWSLMAPLVVIRTTGGVTSDKYAGDIRTSSSQCLMLSTTKYSWLPLCRCAWENCNTRRGTMKMTWQNKFFK